MHALKSLSLRFGGHRSRAALTALPSVTRLTRAPFSQKEVKAREWADKLRQGNTSIGTPSLKTTQVNLYNEFAEDYDDVVREWGEILTNSAAEAFATHYLSKQLQRLSQKEKAKDQKPIKINILDCCCGTGGGGRSMAELFASRDDLEGILESVESLPSVASDPDPDRDRDRLRSLPDFELNVIGVDISTGMINKAKALVVNGKNVYSDFHILDLSPVDENGLPILRLPFADNTFDGVICLAALGYIEEPQGLFKEWCRVTKKGDGVIVASQRTDWLYPGPDKSKDAPNADIHAWEALSPSYCGDRALWEWVERTEPLLYYPKNENYTDEILVQLLVTRPI